MSSKRIIHAPRGSERSCKGWHQEAAMRMLMNNLDPNVAEDPDRLVVYGGTGRAARSWEAFDAIVRSLRELENDETLLIQSGKPVGVFRTHTTAPRVLIANSNLVGRWATWDHFRELERAGLIMFGQMTAGSWIYIGSQGILQGTYETFAAAGRQHFGSDDHSGRLVVSAGLGGMGGAQPLAAAMCGAVFIGIEVDRARAQRRVEQGYLDVLAPSLDEALREAQWAVERGEGRSIGVVGNAAEILPELVRRGVKPDLVTDQTSAHDPLNGYIPAALDAFPEKAHLRRWLTMAQKRVKFQGLPARICWLGYGERAKAGLVFNDLVASGKVKAPIVIGRDHLDCGSVASPNRETEAMRDGSDAIADWPILNALGNAVNGASWVSFHHGGRVGIGYSLHAGQVIVG